VLLAVLTNISAIQRMRLAVKASKKKHDTEQKRD